MSEHTQGPLHVGGDGTIIYDKDGWGVASATVFHGRQEPGAAQVNARRIVACVNACDGKPTELLERAAEFNAAPDDAEWGPPHPIFEMARQIDELTSQRAELLRALEMLVLFTDPKKSNAAALNNALQVIAAARGGV